MAYVGCMSIFELVEKDREEAIEQLKWFQAAYLKQPNILYFHFSFDVADGNLLIINDAWEDADAFRTHMKSDDVAQWAGFAERFIVRTVQEEVYEWERKNDELLP